MSSVVGVCNRALQILGTSERITSLSDNSRNARAMNVAYEPIRDRLLRQHNWNFAIRRAQLAASSTEPLFTKANAFPLPSDFLRLLPTDPEDNLNCLDWQIESDADGARVIVTNDDAPLEIRYIYRVTDPNSMDSVFLELWATDIAAQTCKEVTGSTTLKSVIAEDRKEILREAKKANAFESTAQQPPEDPWVTVRL
jgi:hypothetical protein